MYRKLFTFLLIFFLSINLYAQRIKKQQITEEEAQRIILNINYATYSVKQIDKHRNKQVATSEKKFILDNVSKNFTDELLIINWNNLYNTIVSVELSEDEKKFTESMAEKDRKNAFTNSFNSFGSVFIPGNSTYQFVTSLIYSGTSAIFNYKRTVDEIEKTREKMLFKISNPENKAILEQLGKMWDYSSKLVSNYNLNDLKLISPDTMGEFIDALNYEVHEKINYLDDDKIKTTFEYFPPFWFELGNAYQTIKDYDNAEKYYSIFETLMNNKITNYDVHYVELAKNKIKIYLENPHKNKEQIEKYLQIIEHESPVYREELAKNRYFKAQVLVLLDDLRSAENILMNIFNGKFTSYTEDAISLLREIHSFEQDKKNYLLANTFSQIHFGYCPSNFKLPRGKTKVVSEKNIYWYLPYELSEKYNVSAEIEGKIYTPVIIENESIVNSDKMCFIDSKNTKLHKINFVNLIFKNKTFDEEIRIVYQIQAINKKDIVSSWKAFNRCGLDYATEDPYVIIEFGKWAKSYKYVTSDFEIEKQNLQNKTSEKTEYDEPVYTEKLRKDISTLTAKLEQVKENRYKKTEDFSYPYRPNIVRYSNSFYCVGLNSMEINNEVIKFNNTGFIIEKNEN